MLGRETATLREIVTILRETYCGPIGVEFMHIQDPDQKAWIQRKVEGAPWRTAFDATAKRTILQQLTEAEGFEAFCQKRYVTTKRFGLEGGEITIPALHTIIETVAAGRRAARSPSACRIAAGSTRWSTSCRSRSPRCSANSAARASSPTTCRARAT